jgi:hypothetical protein
MSEKDPGPGPGGPASVIPRWAKYAFWGGAAGMVAGVGTLFVMAVFYGEATGLSAVACATFACVLTLLLSGGGSGRSGGRRGRVLHTSFPACTVSSRLPSVGNRGRTPGLQFHPVLKSEAPAPVSGGGKGLVNILGLSCAGPAGRPASPAGRLGPGAMAPQRQAQAPHSQSPIRR